MKYENNPTDVKHINELAKQAQVLYKNEEAVELWLKLISLVGTDPQSPVYKEIARVSYGDPLSEIYTQLAAAYLELNRFDEALKAAYKAMNTKVKRKEYVNVYILCEIIAGSLDKALCALEDLLQTMPEYSPALFLEALIFCLEKKKEEAYKIFQLLQQKRVEITHRLNNISKQLNNYGKKDEALLILNAAVENKISNQETLRLVNAFQNDKSIAFLAAS
jgi:tetratricopeptide (TPR) repeat protein